MGADSSRSGRTVLSDASGYFTIDNLPEGPVAVVARRVEWDPYRDAGKQVEQWLELRRQETHNLEFILREAQVVRSVVFVVKNERGEAISGSGAEVEVGGSGGLGRFSVFVDSDERGRIRLNVSPESKILRCEISAEGYLTRQVVIDPDLPPAEVVLQEGPLFTGTVLSESGYPLEGAEVNIPERGGGRTDGNGHFAIRLSHPLLSRIEISQAGYLPEVKELNEDVSSLTSPLEVRLKPGREGGGIYGRVVDPDGDPVERFDMYVRGLFSEGQSFSRSFEDPAGIFAIFHLPPGDFRLTVQSRVGRRRLLEQRVDPVTVIKGQIYGELVIRLEPQADL